MSQICLKLKIKTPRKLEAKMNLNNKDMCFHYLMTQWYQFNQWGAFRRQTSPISRLVYLMRSHLRHWIRIWRQWKHTGKNTSGYCYQKRPLHSGNWSRTKNVQFWQVWIDALYTYYDKRRNLEVLEMCIKKHIYICSFINTSNPSQI